MYSETEVLEAYRLLGDACRDYLTEISRHVTDEHRITTEFTKLDSMGFIQIVRTTSGSLVEIRLDDRVWFRRSDDPPGTVRFRLAESDIDTMKAVLAGVRTR